MSMEVTPLDYLTALYAGCDHGHIVFVEPCRSKVSAVFDVMRLDLAAQHIEREPRDLFLKVNVMDHDKTRARRPHGIGGKQEVAAVVSIHLDVDAGKNDKYLTPTKMLEALDAMPLVPSVIVQTNGDDGGFHAYWLLEQPHYIADEHDRQQVQDIATRWQAELEQLVKPGTLDSTANIDRILRPVGSLRKSGKRVQAMLWNPARRYRLEDFALPKIEKPQPEFSSEPRADGESVIERYLADVGLNSVEAILTRYGWSHVRDGFWIHPHSSSGSPTGEIYSKDGRQGFTVKSASSDIPITASEGPWYTPAKMFVHFEHGKDWTAAAKFCHDHFDRQQPQPDTSRVEQPPEPTSGPNATKKPDQPATQPAAKLLGAYFARLKAGNLPQLIQQYSALEGIEVGEGLITVVGAPPGWGKTALAQQIMFDGLELDNGLRAVVANAEMSFDGLLRRELTRMTRIESDAIRFGRLTDDDMLRIQTAVETLQPRLERVSVLDDPVDLMQLMRLRDEQPGLVVVDYLQKFAPGDKDARQGVNVVMASLRLLAKKGWAVLCLSATSRTKQGSHDGKELSLSSFRESGEIEYNADSAYLLVDEGPLDEDKQYVRRIVLAHAKNRHGAKRDIPLQFHAPRMEFTELPKKSPEPLTEFEVFGSANPYDELEVG